MLVENSNAHKKTPGGGFKNVSLRPPFQWNRSFLEIHTKAEAKGKGAVPMNPDVRQCMNTIPRNFCASGTILLKSVLSLNALRVFGTTLPSRGRNFSGQRSNVPKH